MNEKFNKNAKVEKFTNMLGIAVCLIVIVPSISSKFLFVKFKVENCNYFYQSIISLSKTICSHEIVARVPSL